MIYITLPQEEYDELKRRADKNLKWEQLSRENFGSDMPDLVISSLEIMKQNNSVRENRIHELIKEKESLLDSCQTLFIEKNELIQKNNSLNQQIQGYKELLDSKDL